ncbi:MAG: ATP-binding protein [Candidatus Micrarchaeota archaeon]
MKIEDITRQNPWWKAKGWEEQDKHLKSLKVLKYVYERNGYIPKKDGAVVIYGPRQVGKTTWIKKQVVEQLKKNKPTAIFYLDSEMVRDRFELYKIIHSINNLYSPKCIFVDEINSVEDWERAIKALADEGIFRKKQVVLTGSSSLNIMKKAERLPGRMAEGQYKFRFYPLSFLEVANLYGVNAETPDKSLANLGMLNSILHKYFVHGGFIRPLNELDSKSELGRDLFSIYSAWIDGELAKVKKSPEITTNIMDGIADALTNEVSWSSLSKIVTHPTTAEYVESLKDMFVLNFLEKSRHAKAGAPKNKKLYFADPFLYWLSLFRARKISSIRLADLDSTTMGKLAELSAYSSIVQFLDYESGENDFDARRHVHFEKERSGEIDFIAKYKEKTFRLECKFGQIGKEKPGVVYLTKDKFDYNKLPLSVFLAHPFKSLELPEKLL